MSAGPAELLPEVLEMVLVAFGAMLGCAVIGPHSHAGARRRRLWPAGRTRHLVLAALAVAMLAVAVEYRVTRRDDTWLLHLDRSFRVAARSAGSDPLVRATARRISWATGDLLFAAVAVAIGWLAVRRRWRDALVILSGTLGAWLLSLALKLVFRVPRPGGPRTDYAITGFGFPSGHAMVTLVACGLLVWVFWREAGPRMRRALVGAVATAAALSAAARVTLNVHWFSDVIAGLSVGVLWLYLVILMAERFPAPTPPDAPADG